MLDANDPNFRQQYPNGAIVRDRLGRQLQGVEACDPETSGSVGKGRKGRDAWYATNHRDTDKRREPFTNGATRDRGSLLCMQPTGGPA